MQSASAASAPGIRQDAHPTLHAVAWAAIAYPIGALLWTGAAAVSAAVDADTASPGEGIGWFLWAWLWIGILSFVAAPVGIPILIAQCVLWGYLARRFRYFEQDRLAVVQASALLALPWAFVVPWILREPIDGPGPALTTFFAAGIGLAAARLTVPSLRPGALLTRTRHRGATGEG